VAGRSLRPSENRIPHAQHYCEMRGEPGKIVKIAARKTRFGVYFVDFGESAAGAVLEG